MRKRKEYFDIRKQFERRIDYITCCLEVNPLPKNIKRGGMTCAEAS